MCIAQVVDEIGYEQEQVLIMDGESVYFAVVLYWS